MKKKSLFAAILMLLFVGVSCADSDQLSKNFRQVPSDQGVAVYWYWISDNISVEGVQKDLEAMKEKGITRAFIGNIWEENLPHGDIPVLSEGWWEVMHAALKRATELNIELGIFNCPGWSQSGGPWVKPEQAMRYLTSEQVSIEGNGAEQTFQLPDLGEETSDVRVIAYPDLSGEFSSMSFDVDRPDGDYQKDLKLGKEMTVRSLTFTTQQHMLANCLVQIPDASGEYKTLTIVHLDRTNFAQNVGFHPYAPICITLPDVKTKDLRLIFTGGNALKCKVEVSDQPRMERYEEKTLAKMYQTPLPMWGEYMWPTSQEPADLKLLQPSDVLNLTDKLQADGTLKWTVPEGKWIVLRTGMKPTGTTNAPAAPYATGYEIDKMSSKHVASHFDAFLGEILRRIPAEDRKSFKMIVEDSYETGGQNWTDEMIEKFQDRYGYDPLPYLPVMYGQVIGSQDQSERFLWDLRRLIADLVAYEYVGGLREIGHQNGLKTWLECYGHWGFPSEFLMYGGQSDEVAGEFWSAGDLGNIENRAASSCAHIYGKNKVSAESCTSGGPNYTRYPYEMKQRTDRFFTEGINSTLLHLFIQQPDEERFPGMSAWYGNDFQRKNTWWEDMDLFTDYLRRCNYMLQQGRYIADVAYFIGEDAPKMTGECNPALPRGYSFDYINAEVLQQQAHVENGVLKLDGGMEYRVLVLPKQHTMRPDVLETIASFAKSGLAVVGPKPTASPSMENYPEADKEVQEMAEDMWTNAPHVYPDGTELKPILDELGIQPDCYVEEKTPALFIHRSTDNGEVYFVCNQSLKPITFEANFRQTGLVPQLWQPVTLEQRILPQFEDNGSVTKVPLSLLPNESVFVVFRKGKAPKTDKANFPEATILATVETPWTVEFDSEKRGPSEPQTFKKLTSWSENENEAVRYYSGKAVYTNTLEVAEMPNEPIFLDLGNVMVMAKVWVNDEYAGGAWCYPYRVDVTKLLKKGENKIRVEVVNNWQNRLIGDQKLPEAERKTWTPVNPFNAESALQTSGLLGPVELKTF